MPDRSATEAGWIAAIAAGGRAASPALQRIKDAYDRKVVSFCIWHFRLTPAEADDVWQDVLVRIWQHAAEFRPGADPSPWIWKMVRNRATDLLRDGWHRNRSESANEEQGDATDGHAAPPPDDRLAVDECVQRGLQRFARPHPEEAMVVRLRDLEGWAIREVAEYLSRTEEATRTFLCSVRKKLQPFLRPCFDLLTA